MKRFNSFQLTLIFLAYSLVCLGQEPVKVDKQKNFKFEIDGATYKGSLSYTFEFISVKHLVNHRFLNGNYSFTLDSKPGKKQFQLSVYNLNFDTSVPNNLIDNIIYWVMHLHVDQQEL